MPHRESHVAPGVAAGLAVTAVAAGVYVLFCRPWHTSWGATDEEVSEPLPGDSVVPHPKHVATHAITINAPVEEVWPWIVQMGQSKGGFYSYSWLENLVGCHMRNADRIVPEYQQIAVGDQVWFHPCALPAPVIIAEPYETLVLGPLETIDPQPISHCTWGFFLKKIDDTTTRFLTRIRWDRKPGFGSWLSNYAFLEPAHFVMERKMMLTIKRLAEANAASHLAQKQPQHLVDV